MQRRMFRAVLVATVCLAAALTGAACKSGPDDAAITASVKPKVTMVPGGTGINVDTKDGVVTLNGTVDTEAAKASAEAAAKGVNGVQRVVNNLTVKPPAPAVPTVNPNDTAVSAAIQANLTKAGVTGVTVTVKDGVATLTGKVPKANWPKALQAANEANPKPTRVQNSLTE
jgi:hyperosmotically inducible protein